MVENVSSPWKHSACFLTDVLSCDSIFLPQWDPDRIPVGTSCLWLLCIPCWELCPCRRLESEGTAAGWLSCWDNEESVWQVSVSRNDEWKAFLLPGQVWDGKPNITWYWPGLVKGRRCSWEDQCILHWLITRCLMSNEPTLPSVHLFHHSSVIHSS